MHTPFGHQQPRTRRMVTGFRRVIAVLVLTSPASSAQQPADFVNPFIGTSGGGNTFPGALRPWGMVSVSPHNAPGAPSGYLRGQPRFYGFGHVHLSGTGCADLGSVRVSFASGPVPITPGSYFTSFSDEHASPGYYSARIGEANLHAEVTATMRCGLIRVTSENEFTVLINAGTSLALTGGGHVRVTSDHEIEGYNVSGGFCGEANRQTVYFVARFNQSAFSAGVWTDTTVTENRSALTRDASVGAWFRFVPKQDQPLLIATGISYVSIENARENLETELGMAAFETVRSDARAEWNTVLGRVRIDRGDPDHLTAFYTALYHCLIHPNILSDSNGEYPLMGQTGIGRNTERPRYSVFSLWDTYRTLHPLLTLLYPERASSMMQTLLDMYRESGRLPKWELASNETHMMVGDPVVPVLVDTYLKGVSDFDITTAYEAILKHVRQSEQGPGPIRPGYHDLMKLGYIPFDQDTTQEWWVWGPVSSTLEYGFADWTFSRLAEALGRRDDAEEFHRRSLLYRNLFDPSTLLLRPRNRDGSWLEPFDPFATEGSGNWEGSGGPGYVEGNAWNYTWFVPHDVEGLATLFGGNDRYIDRLAECFENGTFTINNEPDIAYPYLFGYFPGGERQTRRMVQRIRESAFGPGDSGLPGNDDAGTISAWFVFSALGFYPACPGSNRYQTGIPLFDKIVLRLQRHYFPGSEITVIRETVASCDEERVLWNEAVPGNSSVGHHDLVSGGILRFHLCRDE